jgi:hypothetical protein
MIESPPKQTGHFGYVIVIGEREQTEASRDEDCGEGFRNNKMGHGFETGSDSSVNHPSKHEKTY